ncbi:hypothetical protein O5853_32265, partial [Escherichia coli]|nr:hypothetical protein [Escherichia coli]
CSIWSSRIAITRLRASNATLSWGDWFLGTFSLQKPAANKKCPGISFTGHCVVYAQRVRLLIKRRGRMV